MKHSKPQQNTGCKAKDNISANKSVSAKIQFEKRRVFRLLALLLLFVSLFVYDFFAHGDNSIFVEIKNYLNSVDESGVENPPKAGAQPSDDANTAEPDFNDPDVFSFLIIGDYDDSGAGTIIADKYAMLSINSRSNKAALNLLSPQFCSAMLQGETKASGVSTEADAQALINGIKSTLDLQLDGYVLISSNDTAKILDAMGGISLRLSEDELNSINTLDGQDAVTLDQTGCAKLNGTQALAYLRLDDSVEMAAGAANRMEAVLMAAKASANELGLIDLSRLGDVILSEITCSITGKQFAKLFLKSPGLLKFRVDTAYIPVPGSYELDSSGAITALDIAAIKLQIYNTVYK